MSDMSSSSTQILVAVIGLVGGVLAALLPIIKKESWKMIVCSAVIGFLIGSIGAGVLFAMYGTKSPGECDKAKIVSPQGGLTQQMPGHFKVLNKVKITWTPQDCVATVQSYQNGDKKPVREYLGAFSGTEFEIGNPNSGLTEIKIWGSSTTNNSVWVWIEEPQKTEEPQKRPVQGNKRR